MGKTRLALRAAAEAAGRYRDGVWLVDLGGTDDPGQVAGAVAAALGVTAGGEAGWPPVLGHLRRRELLLILDTCEHLVDACGEFADTVLRGAPGVTLIVTSRQPLDVPGEHAFPLLPLPPAARRSNCSPSARRPSSPGSASRQATGRTSCGCAGGLTAYRSRSSSPPSGCARCRCRN